MAHDGIVRTGSGSDARAGGNERAMPEVGQQWQVPVRPDAGAGPRDDGARFWAPRNDGDARRHGAGRSRSVHADDEFAANPQPQAAPKGDTK